MASKSPKVAYSAHVARIARFFASTNEAKKAMAYAAPAAGILCLELLKPTLHAGVRASPEITRSIIIQKLSLLVGFFDWNQPISPNGKLCADPCLIIRHVLDHSLNTVPLGAEMPNTFEWDLDTTQPDFNFDLLDTFEWLRRDAN